MTNRPQPNTAKPGYAPPNSDLVPPQYPITASSLYKRDRDGWIYTTTISIPEGWRLEIRTRKSTRGGICTSASCGRFEDGFLTHRMFRDFMMVLRNDNLARCTEKNVTEQHRDVLAGVGAVIERARTHYADLGEPLPAPAEHEPMPHPPGWSHAG